MFCYDRIFGKMSLKGDSVLKEQFMFEEVSCVGKKRIVVESVIVLWKCASCFEDVCGFWN